MPLFLCSWTLFPGSIDACFTVFGGMTEEDDKRDRGSDDIKTLGRWSIIGEGKGFVVFEAPDVKTVYNWIFNWTTMATLVVKPILDDNQARRIILGKEPDFQVDYSHTYDSAKEGESLYAITWKSSPGCKAELLKAFGALTEEADKADGGVNTCLGRWHNIGDGTGFAIASSPGEEALYEWAYHWAPLCDVEFHPVCNDAETREIASSKPGFAEKRQALMAAMSTSTQQHRDPEAPA